MATDGNHFEWCDEMIELATGPTPDITERHNCWENVDHGTEHRCLCGFRWSTEEATC